jgi:hypothetical protein
MRLGLSCSRARSDSSQHTGYYQDQSTQATCKSCPVGFYCTLNTSEPTICPRGSYCPEGTSSGGQFLCPNGTYGNTTGLSALSQCSPCDSGRFCSGLGQTAFSGNCTAGYYCSLGAWMSAPLDGVTGNICPAGYYCAVGAAAPAPCPAGTSTGAVGNTDSSACQLCPVGKYCAAAASIGGVTGSCYGGYFCTGGSAVPDPLNSANGYQCRAGHYCPNGTTAELVCAAGTFNPNMGASACLNCTAGSYCPNTNLTAPILCPTGRYCPAGSAQPLPCLAGTFSNVTGISAASDCALCSTGSYCNVTGLSAPTGLCAAGYYCALGSVTPTPLGVYPANSPCPAGSYCPAGALAPSWCDPGSYTSQTGRTSANDCVACTPGSFCNASGLFAPTGSCAEGFYCPTAVISSQPASYLCPAGFACPVGSVWPVGCVNGNYQDQLGQGTCKQCPGGFYCRNNASLPVTCSLGAYCPNGTATPILCPAGTYGAQTGLSNVSECAVCPSGRYCLDGTQTVRGVSGLWLLAGTDIVCRATAPRGTIAAVAATRPRQWVCGSRWATSARLASSALAEPRFVLDWCCSGFDGSGS